MCLLQLVVIVYVIYRKAYECDTSWIYILRLRLTLDVLRPSCMLSWLNPGTAIAYWGKKQFTVLIHI